MSADGATRRVLRWSLAHPLFWPLLALGLLLLGNGLFNTTAQLFLFSQRPRRGRTDFNQRVFHLLDHQPNQLLRIFRFLQQRVNVGVHDVGKTRKNTHNFNPHSSGIRHRPVP